MPSTQSITRSYRQALQSVWAELSTSLTNPVSSALTSSNTQRLEGSLSSDPNSWIEVAVYELLATLASKNQDYRIDGEFSNFEHTAALVDTTPENVMLTQVGIKIGRLNGLRRSGATPNHEGLLDTCKDLAGYAIILYAYAMSNAKAED
jgi:hypothetical protein